MNKFRMRHAITLALNEEGTQEWDVHKRSVASIPQGGRDL